MPTPRELQQAYQEGDNITAILRQAQGQDQNDEEVIEAAYDLQTGSYVAAMASPEMARHKEDYAAAIAREIEALITPVSLLEAGVGEATTMSGVIRALALDPAKAYGFDLSWSRVAYARNWLESQSLPGVTLCTGSLFHIPFADNSIDVVYTSHTVEPNGGKEEPILRELYRVTRHWLVLLEPCFELAGENERQRMERLGYCRNLAGICRNLGYEVVKHQLFPLTVNPLNPTGIIVIRKPKVAIMQEHVLACPKFRTPLQEIGGMLYSPEALAVYPVLCGIPCLRPESAIMASKYPDFFEHPKEPL